MKSSFAETLSSLRREKDLSQRRAAEDLGVSQALLSHYENGAREPKLEFVVRACDYYGITADYLLGRSAERDGGEMRLRLALGDIAGAMEELDASAAELIARLKEF